MFTLTKRNVISPTAQRAENGATFCFVFVSSLFGELIDRAEPADLLLSLVTLRLKLNI